MGRKGYPNAYGAKIRVESCWDLEYLYSELQGYGDLEVLLFLEFGWPANRLPSAPTPVHNRANHNSALRHPSAINKYICKEVSYNAVMGPFIEIPTLLGTRVGISPLSTHDKRDCSEKRTILDLSCPEGHSVNDHTPKDSYLGMYINLIYPTVDDLAKRMVEVGHNCKMYKRDVSRCFRWIPWDPFDYGLFGYRWDGWLWFDKVLSMGH